MVAVLERGSVSSEQQFKSPRGECLFLPSTIPLESKSAMLCFLYKNPWVRQNEVGVNQYKPEQLVDVKGDPLVYKPKQVSMYSDTHVSAQYDPIPIRDFYLMHTTHMNRPGVNTRADIYDTVYPSITPYGDGATIDVMYFTGGDFKVAGKVHDGWRGKSETVVSERHIIFLDNKGRAYSHFLRNDSKDQAVLYHSGDDHREARQHALDHLDVRVQMQLYDQVFVPAVKTAEGLMLPVSAAELAALRRPDGGKEALLPSAASRAA